MYFTRALLTSSPDDGLRMLMTERETGKELLVGLDSCLEASFRYLQNTNRSRPEDIRSIHKLVKAAYYAFMDESFDRKCIEKCYSELVKRNYREVKRVAEQSMAEIFNSGLAQVRITPLKRDTQKHTMEKLLTEIFYMIAVYYTRETYTTKFMKFFDFVCDHLALIGLCRNGFLTLGRISEIDPLTYLNVITEFLNENKSIMSRTAKKNQITCVAINALKRVAATYVSIFQEEPDAVLNIQLLDLLVSKLCSLCYWKEWMKKEGASLAFSELLTILPGIFFIKHEFEIVRSLFHGLSTLPRFIEVTATQSCPECIYRLIDVCHAAPHFLVANEGVLMPCRGLAEYVRRVAAVAGVGEKAVEEMYVGNFKKLVRLLVAGLHAERKFVRKVARKCVERVARLEKLRIEQLLNLTDFVYVNRSKVRMTCRKRGEAGVQSRGGQGNAAGGTETAKGVSAGTVESPVLPLQLRRRRRRTRVPPLPHGQQRLRVLPQRGCLAD